MSGNLFSLPREKPADELFEQLYRARGHRIERIVSVGHASPEGFWYDQPEDEWVVLLQGRATLAWQNGRRAELSAGDWLLIPAHEKHRVESTTSDPPCIWLAVHGGSG